MAHKHCYLCGFSEIIKDLRPYGKNMQWVCFSCAMQPENKSETERQFDAQLDSIDGVGVIGEQTGPRPLKKAKQ